MLMSPVLSFIIITRASAITDSARQHVHVVVQMQIICCIQSCVKPSQGVFPCLLYEI